MTPSPHKARVFGGLAAAAALALVTSAHAQAPSPTPKRQCFNANSVNGFTPVDDRHVNLHVGVNDNYQLTLFSDCRDIDWSWKLGVRARGGGSFICQGLDAEIIVPDRNFPQRCLVSSIRKLSKEEASAIGGARAPKKKP